MRLTALPLLGATITRDPKQIAAIDFVTVLPWFLFALISGALVDRVDRRKAMGIANVIRGVVVAGLAFSVAAGTQEMFVIYAVGFLLGTAETVFDNASQAILPSLVRKDQLERANGRMYAAEFSTNQLMGPPLGAFLFVTLASAPFFLDAVSFVIAALLILSFRGDFRISTGAEAPASLKSAIAEGVRWLWNHRLIRTLAIMLGIWNALSTAVFAIFVLYALEILGLSQFGFGVLSATFVIGSVIGSLIASRLGKLAVGPTLIAQVVLGAAALLGMGLTSDPIVYGAMIVVVGVTAVVWNVITVSLRQSIIPDHLLGRVNSVYRLLGWGSMPLGAAAGGLLADAYGLRAPYFVAAAILFAMAVVALPVINTPTIERARAEAA